MKKHIYLILIFLTLISQDNLYFSNTTNSSITIFSDFKDLNLGIDLRFKLNKSLALGAFWANQYVEKKVLKKLDENTLIRYLETRNFYGFNGTYSIEKFRNLLFNVGMTYSYARYNGTDKNPATYFKPFLAIDYITSDLLILGYKYLNITNTYRHYISLNLYYGF